MRKNATANSKCLHLVDMKHASNKHGDCSMGVDIVELLVLFFSCVMRPTYPASWCCNASHALAYTRKSRFFRILDNVRAAVGARASSTGIR